MTKIGSYAFSGCTALTTINFDKNTYVTTIADHAFSGCNALNRISIPEKVTSIGNYAFSGCMKLMHVTIEDATSTLSLGYGAMNGSGYGLFADCDLRSFYWGRPLSYNTSYGYSPIANKTKLSEITIGPNVSTISAYMFYGNTAISNITLPETVTTLGNHAFHGFTGLTSYTIPKHITSIGEYAFAGCKGLTSLTIPEWISTIAAGTFSGCTGLTSFVIPNNVNSVGNYAFSGCTGIKTLKFEKGKEIDKVPLTLGYGSSSGIGYGLFYDCPLESVDIQRELSYNTSYKDSNYNNYSNRSPFRDHPTLKKVTIGEEVVRVGSNLFYGNSFLETVAISEGITSINSCAFYNCETITSFVLPQSMETIGVSAFEGCKQLTGLIFHPALKSIGNYAFKGCVAFNNFAIEESEETLTLGNGSSEGEKTGLFKDCPITSVFIGRNLSYNYSPLANMKTLTEARFGNPVTRVPNYIFQGDTELISVVFNRSCELQSVGKYAFDGCANLPTPQFPNTVTVFDEGAFKGCVGFTDFELPENLVTIGSNTFQDCTGLTKFSIPATTTSIGNYAFSGCAGVKLVDFTDGEETLALGYGASKGKSYGLFSDCPLEELYLGRTVSYEVNSKGNFGYSPFYKQEALLSVTVGPKVKELPYCIFYGTAIKELYIPSSVRTLQSTFVNGCPNLKRIIILGATPPNVDTNNTLLTGSAEDSKFYVFFPDKYKSTKPWNNYADKIDACCEIYSNLTYGGDNHLIAYKTDFPIVLENMETEAVDAGTYQKPIDVTYTTNDYTLKDVLNYEYTIKRAPLTVTAKSCSRSYGEENPVFKFDFEGFMNGEDEKVLTKDPIATTKATVNSPVGEYDITVAGAEAKNYEFTYAPGILTITKAPLTISGGEYTMKQGDELPTFKAVYTGFKNEETEAVLTKQPMLTTTATSASNPGDYSVDVSSAEAQNYDITYVNGKLTVTQADAVTVTAKSYTITYGDKLPDFEFSSEGAVLEGTPEIVCEATATSPAGTYPIIIKKGGVTNYNDTYVNGTLTITKAPLTISGGEYTMKQGDELPTFKAVYTGFRNEETEAVLTKQPILTTTATSASEPGDYSVDVSGAEAQNYDITYVNGKLTVTQADAVTVTAKSYTITYGDKLPDYEFTSEGATLSGLPEISCEATATSPVGEYPIVIKKGGVTNYNDTYVNGILMITKAPLTISGGEYTMKQGDELPTFKAVYTGFRNEETEAVLTKQPTLTTTATSASEPGSYEVTVNGAEAQNYDIGYENGILTVTEADPVTVMAKSYTITYGDVLPDFEFSSEGATLEGTPEIVCEATATSPVGEYPIVIMKGGVTNYNDTYVNGTLTITKAPLTISGGEYTMKQGEELPTFKAVYTGFRNEETEAVLTKQPTLKTTATSASEPGSYEVTVNGAEAQNYDIGYENGTLTVTEADPVTVMAKSYTITYGDVLPDFEFSSEGATLEGTPEIVCEATATSPVGEYPIVIMKGGVTNYNDTYVNGTLTIAKAPLTIKAGTYSREQGEQNPEFMLTYEGFKNEETLAVLTKLPSVTTTATADSEPGDYEVVVSGAEAQNYDITYVNGKLTVTVPSGISEVINGDVFDVYTTSGRMVKKNATTLKGLAKGVYIVNGRKVIVK